MNTQSPLFKTIAKLLIAVMWAQPLHSIAANLNVDHQGGGNTHVTTANNGVPVVNIATPNGNGLSHNKFTDYNVGQQGLILNNSTDKLTQTQLGGIIFGNSQLNGKAANTILNEVTGGQRSQLKGYTEVAGQQAHVIVANPHGITCDGCGFINTPQATLTTGRPMIEQGRLHGYDVDGGDIDIAGAGLNASNISRFDLITRSAKINAELHANELNIITGRNQVEAGTLKATAKTGPTHEQPLLAIDSSALGGMYAGAIRLVGTEAGVGVKLAGDMAASAGDIQIDANGKLTLARVSAKNDLHIDAAQDVELTRQAYAGNDINIAATTMHNQDGLLAGQTIALGAEQIHNSGVIEAGINTDGSLNNQGRVRIQSEELTNSGSVVASGELDIKTSGQLDNRSGQLVSDGALKLDSGRLDNRSGLVTAGGDVEVAAAQLDNRDGKLVGQQVMTLEVHGLNNATGTLASNGSLTVQAKGQVNNSNDGLILSQSGGLAVTGQSIDNRDGLLQANTGAVRVTAQQALDNQGGTIQASQKTLELHARQLSNQRGSILADTVGVTTTALLDNRAGQIVATANNLHLSGGVINNDAGTLMGQTHLSIDAESVSNRNGMLGGQTIAINLANELNNGHGLIEATDQLRFNTGSLDNRGGRLRALGQTGSSTFNINTVFDNDQGLVEIGNQTLAVNSQSLTNRDGVVRHLGDQFLLDLGDAGQAGGSFFTNGRLSLNLDHWVNNSELQARQIELNVNHFINDAAGVVRSIEDLQASGNTWLNHGRIETDGSLSLVLSGGYQGRGALHSQGDLHFSAASATLQQGANVRSAANTVFELGGRFQNEGTLTAVGTLQVRAHELENQGTLGAGQWLGIGAGQLLNQGLIFSGADMALRSHTLTNLRGDIYSLGALSIAKDDDLAAMSTLENRSGSIESASNMQLYVASLINRKENFRLGKELVYGHIGVTCYDCSGDHHNVDYVATERFEISVAEDSPAARIHVGGDLLVRADTVANHYSTMSASGNISIVARMLENLAASTGTVQRVQRFNTGRITDGTDERFRWNYINPYNAQPLPKELPAALWQWRLVSDIETETATGVAAPAVIQAGGDIYIKTDETLNNASLLKHEAPAAGISQDVDTRVVSGSQPLVVQLNAQLPPDLDRQAIDPTALPAFALPDTPGGLFAINTQPSHPYLIETNPLFASMGSFINSGYMLAALGYDPDQAQKRLGDGLYEQRLIEQAITARTGKRFLDGLTNNDAQFRYLMDNGIASKEALNLSVGISLTAEQVAALTHDIVWMEEREVQGEKVLVPVVYLAQATDRVAATGALIQGQDLTLISGAGLENSGVLRASNSLTAYAERISNTGLIQADGRLDLLAQDSIHNQRGGLITGRDVSLLAVTGDIINERSITEETRSGRGFSQTTSIVDRAAGIEATGDLALSAGRDLINQGADLKAGAAMELNAGRNVLLVSAEENNGQMRQDKRHFWSSNSTTQHAGTIEAGTHLTVSAGQDIAVVASHVQSGGDMHLQAGGDVVISAAANTHSSEYRYRRSGKTVNQENTQVRQQASVLEAGSTLVLQAGTDLNIIGSQVQAGQDVHLEAGQDMHILSAQDESASFYFKKSKGSLGRSKSKQQESYQSSNVASVIDAGRNLTVNTTQGENGAVSLDGGRNVTLVGSQLKAGNDLVLGATGDIAVLSGIEEQGSYSKKTKSGFLGLSKSGKSQLKTTATQVGSELEAGNDLVVLSGRDIGVRASELNAGQDVELHAGLLDEQGDINLLSADNQAYSLSEKYRSKPGVSVSGGMLSVSAAKKAGQAAQSSTSVGSQVVAQEDASLYAERDINLVGSSVSAGGSVLLDARRDVRITAAQNQQADSQWQRERRTGIALDSDRNGFTAFAGNDIRTDKQWDTQHMAAASQLDAGLDVNVRAGQDIRVTGSDLAAGRDINLGAERNILLDAASEQRLQQQEEIRQRTGLTVNISHNAGNTLDALKDLGKGDNALSKVSSVLKAADSVTQFVSGPTTAEHLGTTRQTTHTTEQQLSQRESSLMAGRDINLQAGESIITQGALLHGQRDINLKAQDIQLDVARGGQQHSVEQTLSQSGINGGTTFNSARAGIGGSHGTESEEGWQGSSLPTRLHAGRDVQLDAENDLTLIGSQIQAGRDIELKAGNDLAILAATNDSSHQTRRKSGGGEVGVALGGQDFISLYASVDIGRGRLDREGQGQQEAYLYAGNRLAFNSGRDTTIAGAQLEGEQVVGRVGRDLRVASVPDTGKVSGKELDASVTVSIGYGSGSVSGSVGVGKTTGSTDWVDSQTRIVARDELDIRTEKHTQLDGAVLASKTGNLKLDTDTLGFRDLEGHDRERSWYINAGGTYSWGGDSTDGSGQSKDGNAAATQAVVDSSQDNKDGSNQWNVSGYHSKKEREQIVRATVGEGEIIVRNDAETGRDSTQNLNRDTDKAYEITQDKQETTKLYVSSTSLEAMGSPVTTVKNWAEELSRYDEKLIANFEQLSIGANVGYNRIERALGRQLVSDGYTSQQLAEQALEALLLGGMGLGDAKALITSEAFQQQVLAELTAINGLSEAQLREAGQLLAGGAEEAAPDASGTAPTAGASTLVLPDLLVTPQDLDALQQVLRHSANVQEYIEENPDKALAVGVVLSALQGPKGLMQLAVMQALSGTELGAELNAYLAELQDAAGQLIAEGMEGSTLEPADYEDDRWLTGGGSLLASIVTGGLPGKGTKVTKPKRDVSVQGGTLSKKIIEDFSRAGQELDPADKSGLLTVAGRALQKHGGREGSVFPGAKGSPYDINLQGQRVVNEILSSPIKTVTIKETGRFGVVTDIIVPDGRGVRYDATGKFIGFLEPPK